MILTVRKKNNLKPYFLEAYRRCSFRDNNDVKNIIHIIL